MRRKKTRMAAAAALVVLLAAGCAAGYGESIGNPTVTNTSPAELVVFPEYVGNVYTKCDHGNRIYVHLDTGSLDAVEDAQGCEATRD